MKKRKYNWKRPEELKKVNKMKQGRQLK